MQYYTTTTEFNCGIDLHSRQMYVCVMDRAGKLLLHTNVQGNDFDYFLRRIEPWRKDLTATCECTFNWYWLADACEEAGIKFVLAHALYLRCIHGGKHKNDKEDAKELADILRTNRLPPAYVYPRERRPVRTLLRRRIAYVWQRSELLGHLSCGLMVEGHAPIAQCQHRVRDAWFGKVLAHYPDGALLRHSVESDMFMVRAYDQMVQKLETELLRYTKRERGKEFALLQTIPGVGPILALTILYELDTIERFARVQDFLSYCRLVKGTVASAGKVVGHKGSKLGNGYLKWAFREAALIGKRYQGPIQRFAQKLEAKHGKPVANAILAAKLGRAVYYMLKSGKGFDPELFVGKRKTEAERVMAPPSRGPNMASECQPAEPETAHVDGSPALTAQVSDGMATTASAR
jgi:transposase